MKTYRDNKLKILINSPQLSTHFCLATWINILSGAAAQRGPGPPHSWGSYITHNDTSQSVGLLSTRDRSVAPDNTQHSRQTEIVALGGIRTRNSSKQATADPRLRPLGHCDRLSIWISKHKLTREARINATYTLWAAELKKTESIKTPRIESQAGVNAMKQRAVKHSKRIHEVHHYE